MPKSVNLIGAFSSCAAKGEAYCAVLFSATYNDDKSIFFTSLHCIIRINVWLAQ